MSLPRLFRAPPNSPVFTVPVEDPALAPVSSPDSRTQLARDLQTEFTFQLQNVPFGFCPRYINGNKVPSRYHSSRWIRLGYRPGCCKHCGDFTCPYFPSTATFYESRTSLDSAFFAHSITESFHRFRRTRPSEHEINSPTFSFIVTCTPTCKRRPSLATTEQLTDQNTHSYQSCTPLCSGPCCLCPRDLVRIDPLILYKGTLPTLLKHPRNPGTSFSTRHFLNDDFEVGCVHCASPLHTPFHQLVGDGKTETRDAFSKYLSPDEIGSLSSLFRIHSIPAEESALFFQRDFDVGFNYLSGLQQTLYGELRLLLPIPNYDYTYQCAEADPSPVDRHHSDTFYSDPVSSFCRGPFYEPDLIYRSLGAKYALLEISRFSLPGPPNCLPADNFHHARDLAQIYFLDDLSRSIFKFNDNRTNFSPRVYAEASSVFSNTFSLPLRGIIRQFLADNLQPSGDGHPWNKEFSGLASIFDVKRVIFHKILNFLHDSLVENNTFPPFLCVQNSYRAVNDLLTSYNRLFTNMFGVNAGDRISPEFVDLDDILPAVNDDYSSPLALLSCENDRNNVSLPIFPVVSGFIYKTNILTGTGPAGTPEWRFQRILIARYLNNVFFTAPVHLPVPPVRPWNRYPVEKPDQRTLFGCVELPKLPELFANPLTRKNRVSRGYSGLRSPIPTSLDFGPHSPAIGKFHKHALSVDRPDPNMTYLLPAYYETDLPLTKAAATAKKPSVLFREGINSQNHTHEFADGNYCTFLNFYLHRLNGCSGVNILGNAHSAQHVFPD